MRFLQNLLQRGRGGADPLRESAALTTVYLQEQNKKFEAFVRDKIAELESVVSGLEARAATVAGKPPARETPPEVTPAAVDEQGSVSLLAAEESPATGPDPAPLPDTADGYSLLDEQETVSLLAPSEETPAAGPDPLVDDDLPPDEPAEAWQRFLGVTGPKGEFE